MSGIGHHGLLLAAGGAAAWTPANLGATLAFWGNESSALTQSAGVASQWDDARANGRSFNRGGSGTSSDNPTVNNSGLNSKRTLEFSSSDYLDSDSGLLPFTNGKGFLGCVAVYQNRSSSSATRPLLSAATNSITTVRFELATSRAGATDKTVLGVRRLDADSFATLDATTGVSTNWCIDGVRMDYANGDGFVDVNGTLGDSSNLSLTSTGVTQANDSARIRLCARPNNPAANFCDVNLAEILFLSAASKPTDSDFDKINGYLAHKWGLASLLPALHPYKSAPP